MENESFPYCYERVKMGVEEEIHKYCFQDFTF